MTLVVEWTVGGLAQLSSAWLCSALQGPTSSLGHGLHVDFLWLLSGSLCFLNVHSRGSGSPWVC